MFVEATREEEWPAASDGAFGTATGVSHGRQNRVRSPHYVVCEEVERLRDQD